MLYNNIHKRYKKFKNIFTDISIPYQMLYQKGAVYMGMTKEACRKAYELVCSYQNTAYKKKIEKELIILCMPAIRQVSSTWKDTPVMDRCDVDQELSMLLLDVAGKFPKEKRQDFIQCFVVAGKRKLKEFISEKTGIPVPHSSMTIALSKGVNVKPQSESYDAILESASEDGAGAGKLRDKTVSNPLTDLLKKEAGDALKRYVAALDDDERELIRMYIDGESSQEIAEDIGEPDYDVYRKINSVLLAIRKGLESEGFTSPADFRCAC